MNDTCIGLVSDTNECLYYYLDNCLDCVSITFVLLVTGVYTVLKPLSPQADAHQL